MIRPHPRQLAMIFALSLLVLGLAATSAGAAVVQPTSWVRFDWPDDDLSKVVAGSQYTIQWSSTSTNVAGFYLSMQLDDGTGQWHPLPFTDMECLDGAARERTWTAARPPEHDVDRVRLRIQAVSECGGTSDAVVASDVTQWFEVPMPRIKLLSPNGGETLELGEVYEIEYELQNAEGVCATCLWLAIGGSPGDTSPLWAWPGDPDQPWLWEAGPGYGEPVPIRLVVNMDVDGDYEWVSYDSSEPLIVGADSDTDYVNLWAPDPPADEPLTLDAGAPYTIRWGTDGDLDFVSLFWSADGGDSFSRIARCLPAGDEAYEWTVPDTPTEQGVVRALGYDDCAFLTRNLASASGESTGPLVVAAPADTCGARFPDVAAEHPACAAIELLAERGIVQGFPDGEFKPDRLVTRAEFAKMLVLAAGVEPAPDASLPFSDTAGHWAATGGYLQAAIYAGAIDGFPDGTFRPDDPVTRAQVVKIVAATEELSPSGTPPYDDVPAGAWYEGWVAAAHDAWLIGPDAAHPLWTQDLFGGGDSGSRAEAAMALANYLSDVRSPE